VLLPKYVLAQQHIISDIAHRRLDVGDRLPSENQLSAKLATSVITIRRALDELRQRGLIERFQGKGTFLKQSFEQVRQSEPVLGEVALLNVQRRPERSVLLQPDVIRSAEVLRAFGYGPRPIALGSEPSDALLDQLSGVTGAIVTGRLTPSWITLLDALTVPYVVLGYPPPGTEPWAAMYDWREAARLLVHRLCRSGCRRIGLINGARSYLPAVEIDAGYREGLRQCQLSYDPSWQTWVQAEERATKIPRFLRARAKSLDGLVLEADAVLPLLYHQYSEEPQRTAPMLGLLARDSDAPVESSRIHSVEFEQDVYHASVNLLLEQLRDGPAGARLVLVPPRRTGLDTPATGADEPPEGVS
jgi:DNA-binding LacI/PurR family transcriptional regulator